MGKEMVRRVVAGQLADDEETLAIRNSSFDTADYAEGVRAFLGEAPSAVHLVMTAGTNGLHAAVERAATAASTARPEFGAFFLARFLDLDISYDDEARTCTVVLPYAEHLCNPQGSVHGGVLTTAMDISMGHLCHRFLSTAVTIEMNLRFFRPAHRHRPLPASGAATPGAGSCTSRPASPTSRTGWWRSHRLLAPAPPDAERRT